jgi:chromosome segregation protein
VTGEAYSIIEQGKVDSLLQSSPRDRRAIFEEAAGISRFKAKKIESLRRLERVDQNLLRLADIVEEVENRLKSVRLQASKARRYKELAQRLQDLRTQVGLADWRRLSEQLDVLEAEIQSLRDRSAGVSAAAEAQDVEVQQLETQITADDEAFRGCESRRGENRQRITSLESTVEHQRARSRDLEEEAVRHRGQLAAMNVRAGDLEQQVRQTAQAVAEAEDEHRRKTERLAADEQRLVELNQQVDRLHRANEARRADYLARMRRSAALGNQISSLEAEVAAAESDERRFREQAAEAEQTCGRLADESAQLQRRQEELAAEAQQQQADLAVAQSLLAELRSQLAVRQSELAACRERLSGAVERAALLEELEQRQEGVSAGVKEVLARCSHLAPRDEVQEVEPRELPHTFHHAEHDDYKNAYARVQGLVAELFRVHVETAPLIDVALGEATGHLVVDGATDDEQLIAQLEADSVRLPGRVGFIPLQPPIAERSQPPVDLDGCPGVLGRADRFVETAPQYARLARRLLGQTWIVERLSHALALAKAAGPETRFVTLAGELLAGDGTLVVGPRLGVAGLISRRSELRALNEQIAELESRIHQCEAAVGVLESQIAEQDRRATALAAACQQASGRVTEQRVRVLSTQERLAQLEAQRSQIQQELKAAEARHQTASQSLVASRVDLEALETELAALESEIATAGREVVELDEQRQMFHRQTTADQVELAKHEERLGNLRTRLRQFEHDQEERRRAIQESHQHLAQCQQRERDCRFAILGAESELAHLYLAKEQLAAEAAGLIDLREAKRARRTELAQQVHGLRSTARKLEEELHGKELSASQLRLERGSLASRLRDDYGIELAELEHVPTDEEKHQREEVDQEIADLRRKINNIGSVNLDALGELEELETRFNTLSSQYKDLTSAKASLEQIIHKINADSRRLFSTTLETVRAHFQELFRKLFGGGMADIVLEEDVDILDSGIDIVARPPGKELRSILLLSGGEKTLTCVAMLLAIFRSRPSPFCVLDEVDAALDEANIERFVGVLKDFLTWTQFVVVTHSKKTMACASTLYGVTMQESGVSKRVAVRFDDVSDNGEIRSFGSAEKDEAAA